MIHEIAFKTDRLRVETWDQTLNSHDERKALATELSILLTPSVLKHLPEPLQLPNTDCTVEDWIKNRASESDVLTIRDAETTLVGLLILSVSHEEIFEEIFPATIHLGYLFSEPAWGKGYGTEIISGLISWFRNKGDAVQLFGGVEKENVASARVLEKNGFKLNNTASNVETNMFGLYIPAN